MGNAKTSVWLTRGESNQSENIRNKLAMKIATATLGNSSKLDKTIVQNRWNESPVQPAEFGTRVARGARRTSGRDRPEDDGGSLAAMAVTLWSDKA
jgi:hypothetical protein